MHRIKKTLVWLLTAVLLATALPGPFARQASAATATYFIPDILAIRDTAKLVTDDHTDPNFLSRSNVYLTTTGTITIEGTYSYVSGSSMAVKVEQLNASTDSTGAVWVTDSTHVSTAAVTQVSGTTNRFSASNLTLFPGFNKITFSGMQGVVQRTDVFYVLYDSVPYVQSIQVMGSSAGAITLNENTQVVVDSQNVTLTGVVQNATSVSVSLNGQTAVSSSVVGSNFYTPTLKLSPGLNTLTLTIANGSDSVNVSRVLYYFNSDQPFTKLDIIQNVTGAAAKSLLNQVPTLTDGDATNPQSAKFQIQMLVPYSAYTDGRPFAGNATFQAVPNTDVSGGSTSVTPTTITATTDDVVIPGPDGVTPAYRLVTFDSPAGADYDFTSKSGMIDSLQNLKITVTYGSFSATYNAKFNFYPGSVVITNMYYLPDYDGTSDVTTVSKEALNGVEVPSADFYIMVDSGNPLGASAHNLTGVYLPLSTNNVNLTFVAGAGSNGLTGSQEIYKVTGFSSGVQQVKFYYTADSGYNATITFASKNYIYLENLFDGQTYTFDSSKTGNSISISGQYVGFDHLDTSSVQFFINGAEQTPPSLDGDKKFTIPSVAISGTGPLYPGENTIVFKGVNLDAAGNRTEIVKSVRIYIVDTFVPNILKFHPVPVPSDNVREPFTYADPDSYTSEQINNIFAVSTDFTKKADGVYETSKKSYDLVLSGSGAVTLNLYKGSDLFFPLAITPTDSLTTSGTFSYGGKTYYYDYAGSQDYFMLRIRDIAFDENSLTDIYNLEVINPAGAKASQKLEIDRVISSYRVVAPQPTVGNDIVVNKNFVHFDIEAEGAKQVIIDKAVATPRPDVEDRFEYDYIGLKPNKNNAIKIQIVRDSGTISDTINVYYTDTVQVDTQYMAPMNSKLSIFNKGLQLEFPKGTVLQSAYPNSNGITKYYTNTNLLFGIADPVDGVVGRRNDYGNVINHAQTQADEDRDEISIPQYLILKFLNNTYTSNFTPVSPVYWISGGEGEYLNKGETGYKPSTNGLQPYSNEGNFTEFPLERKVVPSERGTLTIAFNPSVVSDAGTTLTVFRYSADGVWENIGGEVDTKNHTITVPFDEFGYYKVMKLSRSFSDITNHGWARNILNALYSKGIMINTGANTFGTDDVETRGEFASLLVKGLNIPLNYDNNNTFYDVVPSAVSGTWSYKYIETAARAGIVNGLSEGFFSPDGKLSREEAAVMIARALELALPTNDSKLDASLAKSFLDSASIGYYAKPAVSAVNKAKIMTGSPVTVTGSTKTFYNFNPKSYLTRAEAGKIAVALLQKSTKLFPANLS